MIVEKGSDYILYLNLKDDNDTAIRVQDCVTFSVRVFTNDKKKYLLFDKNNVDNKGDYDIIYIYADQLEVLNSGVIGYTYYYSVNDNNFTDDEEYNRHRTVYTNDYFRNISTNIEPSNPVTIKDIKRIEDIITYENNRATSAEQELDNKISDVSSELETEINRATNAETELNTNLESEISRATNNENEISANLTSEINRAKSSESTITSKLEEEITRAKAAEKSNADAISILNGADNVSGSVAKAVKDESTRAQNKENEISTSVSNEVSRATSAESTLTTNLNAEITRATNKENELSTSISSEITRATNAENSLKERIDSITMRVENEILYLSL